ncbi:MAG: DUF488 domain-containing protein [Candidatus Bathyarchaeota archaeon]|nr:DUF488 domain-containing protein [Candidatus Bathyarchaeota archaeon]
MIIKTNIQTIGYGGMKPDDFFDKLGKMNPNYVVDVRENPHRAYLGCYTKAHLEKRLANYIWIKELGNKTRKMPPTLVNEELGIARLRELCKLSELIVLLCAEKDEARCHRSYIKKRINCIL